MAATATVQSRSNTLFSLPMPSFKGPGTGSMRSIRRAASPAPSTSSRRDDPAQSQSTLQASPPANHANAPRSSASIKSGKSFTGSLLSIRSLGKIASLGRLGARARPAHPPPETFTYLKDLVLVDEPQDMGAEFGALPRVGDGTKSGSEGGAIWGNRESSDRARQGPCPSNRIQNHAIPPSGLPQQSHPLPHDHHPHPDEMPTRTHTLPPGAAPPAPSTSRAENGNVTAPNKPPAPASESDPSSSTNPLQRPRSKSRTIIRMLTTKFSHPSSSSNSNSSHPQASSSNHPTSSTSAHHPHPQLKIPKAPKPKAPPKVTTTAFGDPAARAAALRARGLLPPLPVLDLSEQERERDARLPILESEPPPHEGGPDVSSSEGQGQGQGQSQGDKQAETAADRIKREWATRNSMFLSPAPSEPVPPAPAPAPEPPQVQVEADPQMARMRTFKFGGSTPPTPTAETAAKIMEQFAGGAEAKAEAEAERDLIDFSSEPAVAFMQAESAMEDPAPAPAPAATAVAAAVNTSAVDAVPTITSTEGSTLSTAQAATTTTTATTADVPASPAAHAAVEEVSTAAGAGSQTESVTPTPDTLVNPAAPEAPMPLAPSALDVIAPGSSASEMSEGLPVNVSVEGQDRQVATHQSAASESVLPWALTPPPPPAAVGEEKEGTMGEEHANDSQLAETQTTALAPSTSSSVEPEVGAEQKVNPEKQQGPGAETEAVAPTEAAGAPTQALSTSLESSQSPEVPSTTPATRSIPSPPTSPSLRSAFSQTPPASPPPARDLPPIPRSTAKALPPSPGITTTFTSASTLSVPDEHKDQLPAPLAPSLSSDTQTSTESDESAGSGTSGSTTESAPVVTPVTPAFASSNNPFANNTQGRVPPIPKGKLGDLSVKTHGGLGILPVVVQSPGFDGMQGVPLEVVVEEEGAGSAQEGGWLGSQATTPAAVVVDKDPADDILETMGLDKGAFSRGLAEDNSLALGLGLDATSPGTELATPSSPTLTPLSPNRVPSVTISSPAPTAMPRTKKRGMTDPGAPDRRKSIFGGFRKTEGAANEGTDNRRVSVVASLGNLRRSVVGTISGGEKKDKKSMSRSRSPRRFDASHLPPSPLPFNASSNGPTPNVNDAYRSEGMPSSPRTVSSYGSGSAMSHASNNSKTVLAPGSAPQLRRGTVPMSPMQRRTAVEPVMYSRGSILLETANIEDEETRRMTEMAFLG